MENSNRSGNVTIHDVSVPARRQVLTMGWQASVAASGLFSGLAGCASSGQAVRPPLLGFQGVPMNPVDGVMVPPGYDVQVLYAWGDPAGLPGSVPSFAFDASNTGAEQALQAGMHHDGMAFFALDGEGQHGLLAINHEYVDHGLLFADGESMWSADKVAKSQQAHGVSVIEVRLVDAKWRVVRPSSFARRITALTPMGVTGPAAGHPLMQTPLDPTGKRVIGTFNNCASGATPWGTYLTCEENFADYFAGPVIHDPHLSRWGIAAGQRSKYRWDEFDGRFRTEGHMNEPNRFGWVVEIDPRDPKSSPIKRTALGRAAHEGATTVVAQDGRAVVYMGEDAQFEYIYKFVSRDAVRPGGYQANRDLLDHGTLYVARFDSNGSGEWLALTHGRAGLTQANGFRDQGEVLIKSRQASDLLGGTKMDRPEWITVDVDRRHVYCSLTNNTRRGMPGEWPTDAANPRANNTMGHIIRWQEADGLAGTTFSWEHFVLAGDAHATRPDAQGNVQGDAFGSPDGLTLDGRGVLWIHTDVSSKAMGEGDYKALPRNQLLACDPQTREVRRFLVGPNGCEVTGAVFSPDMRSMFVNIQHPGEPAQGRTDPNNPAQWSSWPDFKGRPRSATIVIRRHDEGIIGT